MAGEGGVSFDPASTAISIYAYLRRGHSGGRLDKLKGTVRWNDVPSLEKLVAHEETHPREGGRGGMAALEQRRFLIALRDRLAQLRKGGGPGQPPPIPKGPPTRNPPPNPNPGLPPIPNSCGTDTECEAMYGVRDWNFNRLELFNQLVDSPQRDRIERSIWQDVLGRPIPKLPKGPRRRRAPQRTKPPPRPPRTRPRPRLPEFPNIPIPRIPRLPGPVEIIRRALEEGKRGLAEVIRRKLEKERKGPPGRRRGRSPPKPPEPPKVPDVIRKRLPQPQPQPQPQPKGPQGARTDPTRIFKQISERANIEGAIERDAVRRMVEQARKAAQDRYGKMVRQMQAAQRAAPISKFLKTAANIIAEQVYIANANRENRGRSPRRDPVPGGRPGGRPGLGFLEVPQIGPVGQECHERVIVECKKKKQFKGKKRPKKICLDVATAKRVIKKKALTAIKAGLRP